ncbi:MAG: uroporphyrinogen decarboxylase family protein [Planctomycetes bacterium]|nr:uroporphyrinogen decarboxylase family protein [Planctomycetota bacterium]
MTGLDRVIRVLSSEALDPPPVLPILHTGLAAIAGIPLGRYFTDAEAMAAAIVDGYRRFGYDGVQLSLGVTGEAEALGARVEQPPDRSPILREHLLADPAALDSLRRRDPAAGGRMPLFFDAVERTARAIGREAFVLATMRGPFVIGAQLRGIEPILIDLIEDPRRVAEVLAFATDVAIDLAHALRGRGAHGILLGEATCSPNFIAPSMYRQQVVLHHARLVRALHEMGWRFVGLHICGNIVPIIEDILWTGVDFFDVDFQVPAANAVARAAGRVALRGNLDPSADLRFGTPDRVRTRTEALRREVVGARWIISSGCDIPPGTPAETIAACVEAARAGSSS